MRGHSGNALPNQQTDGGTGKTTFVKRHLTGEFEKKYERMAIEEAKKLDHFLCSDCSSDDDAKRSLNSFPVSTADEVKTCILVAGALGGRFDHEVGNINVLCRFSSTRIVLLSDNCRFLNRAALKSLEESGTEGSVISPWRR